MRIQKDKIQHFGACAIIAFVTTLAMSALLRATIPVAWATGFLTATAAGLGKEYGDSKAVGNRWDNMDLKADLLGATFGSIMAVVIEIIIHHT